MIYTRDLEVDDIKVFNNYFKKLGFNIGNLKSYSKIYVLISGGFDSTLLAEWISYNYPEKTYFVNCYNPYEQSIVLHYYSKKNNFMQIKPNKNDHLNYGSVLKESFMKLPQAFELKKRKKYSKRIFPCCYHIKHKHFYKDKRFKEENSVVISGIKRGWFSKENMAFTNE